MACIANTETGRSSDVARPTVAELLGAAVCGVRYGRPVEHIAIKTSLLIIASAELMYRPASLARVCVCASLFVSSSGIEALFTRLATLAYAAFSVALRTLVSSTYCKDGSTLHVSEMAKGPSLPR